MPEPSMDNVQLEITLRRDVFLRVESSALSDGLELSQWVENALKFYLDDRGDLNSINKRLARLDARVDLLDEVLSRLQRIEDRLDMLD
jgi:tetrahydromethanopterin S-methyltransferase subunit G